MYEREMPEMQPAPLVVLVVVQNDTRNAHLQSKGNLMPDKLSPMQREQLALMLVRRAADIVEFLDEFVGDNPDYFMLQNVDPERVAAQLHTWLKRLPSDRYPTRLLPKEER